MSRGRDRCQKPFVWSWSGGNSKIEALHALEAERDRLVKVCERRLAVLEQLRQSLLHKAFIGELTAKPERAMQEAAI